VPRNPCPKLLLPRAMGGANVEVGALEAGVPDQVEPNPGLARRAPFCRPTPLQERTPALDASVEERPE